MKMTREEYLEKKEAIMKEFDSQLDFNRSSEERHEAWTKRDNALDSLWFELLDGMEVGDHANVRLWTDVEPCTIIKRTAKTITVRYDKAVKDPAWTPEWITGGFSAICTNDGEQKWIISEDPDGQIGVFRRRKNGWFDRSDCCLTPGWRKYYDHNF